MNVTMQKYLQNLNISTATSEFFYVIVGMDYSKC